MCRVDQSPAQGARKSVVQAYLETDFDYWCELHADRTRYDAEKQRVAAEARDRLEYHLPGLSASIEMTDVATPHTFWRYTHNFRGSYEGWLMTPEAMTARLPKRLPGLADFHLAGQWVEPGGGVPTVLLSGRQAVQRICRDAGRPFVTNSGWQNTEGSGRRRRVEATLSAVRQVGYRYSSPTRRGCAEREAMRRRASSQYCSETSNPTYRRPTPEAARQVVPEPANGSSTTSPT